MRAGLQVALYDYVNGPQADITAVTTYLRRHGPKAVALVGTSEGAKASMVAAGSVRPDAIVSLSAESELAGVAVAPYAAKLKAPTLFVTAAQDPYGATDATRAFYKACPVALKRLLVVAGDAHGTALLAAPSVAREVTTFLEQTDR